MSEEEPDWKVRERVHVMPMGYEYERVVEPAENMRADHVVLIGHRKDEQGSKGEKYWNKVTKELDDKNISYTERRCDIFDLYTSLETIAESISRHAEDDVYVNISTGSKVTAVAGMIASMVLESTAYYVKAGSYEGETPSEVVDVMNLPAYPIDAPDHQQVTILEFIDTWTEYEGPPTKGEIIHFSEQENLSYIRQNVAGKGKYRLLDTHIVEPLKERGWIEVTKQGRSKVLNLTENGIAALQAFRWIVDEEIDVEKYHEEGFDDEEKDE